MANFKHISGISFVASGSLNVIFNYCSDLNYDVVGIIEDVTIGGDAPSSITYTSNQVTIIYQNYTSPTGGFKTYNVTFGSGYNTDIQVDVLGVNRAIGTGNHIGLAKDCASDIDYTQSIASHTLGNKTGTYAAFPLSDPADVFSYPNLWEVTSSEAVIFNGSQINNIWNTTTGYSGGKAATPFTAVQHVRLMAAVDTTFQELTALGVAPYAFDFFVSALFGPEAYSAVAAFDWAMNLPNCKSSINVFDVCKDPSSPSYFNITHADCNGVPILAPYTNGSIPATFIDGCACAVDCSSIDVSLSVTPASYPGATDGSFALTVTGGVANYSYVLTPPAGVVYLGIGNTILPTATHTFTGVQGTPATGAGVYLLSITDGNDCNVKFKVHMPSTNPASLGCTNASAFNYNSEANTNDNTCVLCNSTTGNLVVGGVDQGDFVSTVNTIITPTTSETSSDGSIQFYGEANSQIAPFITGSTYSFTLYNTTGNNQPPIGTGTTYSGLATPIYGFGNLPAGWYAFQVQNTSVPGCIAWQYMLIPFTPTQGPCDDDINIDFVIYDCGAWTAHVASLVAIDNTYYTINGVAPAEQNQSQIVEENDIITFTVEFEEGSFCDTYTESYTVGAINCPPPPPVEIPGCMDITASNYNPLATVDDGSCSDIFTGCMDPSAANYNPLATVNDGSCVYGIAGCMEPTATNYDPSATIANNSSCVYACTELEITNISVLDSGGITVSFLNITPSYTLTWVNNDTGATITTEDTTTGPDLVDGVYTVTVTDGNGCTDVYILGVNTTIVYGCMDIYADNYNQAANSPDNSCSYSFVPSPCTPSEIEATKTQLDKCLSVKLDMVFNMLKSGRLTLCKEKAAKVLVLLRYLLSRRDLGCVYNCADSLSPTYSETPQGESCGTQWSEGGPTGESLVWDSTVTYLWGDIVQHPTSGDTYTMTYTQGSYTPGSDPETEAGLIFWEYCREPFAFTDTTNRLDAYIAFIREECKDCGIPGFTPIPQDIETNQNLPTPTTEEGQRLNIEGDTLEIC